MITWGDTINLILDMFDSIDQNGLAELLGISKSALSKIKTGRQAPSFNIDTVFSKVFDPDNPKSLANDTPDFLLETLKSIIKYPKYSEIQNVMKDLWDETDYNVFVTKLLSRTRSGAKSNSASPQEAVPQEASPQEAAPQEAAPQEAAPQEAMEESLPEPAFVSEDSPWIGGADMLNWGTVPIRSKFLPHADKNCCYYCKFWQGDKETIGAYLTSTYGPCLKNGRERKLSSDMACMDFIEQTEFPMEW